MKPDNIILEGITGSKAYGLDTPTSDEDIKGIYLAPTRDVLALHGLPTETIDHYDPDWTYHEVGKFMRLAIKGNPTLTEMLWLDGYTVLTRQGKTLVDNRHLFLTTKAIRGAYGGYCLSQARKLNARGGSYGPGMKNRYAKHTRHLLRLLIQGRELLETGKLTVRVTPAVREHLFASGELEPHQIIDLFSEEFAKFDKIQSVLPDEVDVDAINQLLLRIRKGNW